MAKFDHLAKLRPDAAHTADYPLYELESVLPEGAPIPWLRLKPALEQNKAYAQAVLAKSVKEAPKRRRGAALSLAMIETDREIERECYAEHVVTAWGGVLDSDGKEVPFNAENCLEFLQAIPAHVFDAVREFAANPRNFTADGVSGEDVEETEKNSGRGSAGNSD